MTSVAELLSAVRADGLLAPGRAVVVMLSGGRDSTCLIDVAASICGPGVVTALHVNYGLRAGADGDEQYCRELCGQLGVELRTLHAGGGGDTETNGVDRAEREGNLQNWARELRYSAARELAAARGAEIAAGHTATDQVETILYRLASSPSRRALLGMAAKVGPLVRPLLRFTREDTSSYCSERLLRWRDDETNETSKYARGRVRNELVPALQAIHPGAERNVLMLAEILRDESAVLDALVDQALSGSDAIAIEQLRALPVGVARLVVQRLADAVYAQPAPGAARRLDEILALKQPGTSHLDLPHAVRATVAGGILRLTPTDAKHS